MKELIARNLGLSGAILLFTTSIIAQICNIHIYSLPLEKLILLPSGIACSFFAALNAYGNRENESLKDRNARMFFANCFVSAMLLFTIVLNRELFVLIYKNIQNVYFVDLAPIPALWEFMLALMTTFILHYGISRWAYTVCYKKMYEKGPT